MININKDKGTVVLKRTVPYCTKGMVFPNWIHGMVFVLFILRKKPLKHPSIRATFGALTVGSINMNKT